MNLITVTPNTSVDRTLEVPRLAPGGHLKGRLLHLQPGGKGVNVSRCLAALGVPSVATGLAGGAELSLFRDSFAGSAASVELVPTGQPTRMCTTLLDPELHTDTHIRELGSPVTPAEIAALGAKLQGLASPDTLVVFCGSLPPGMGDEHLAQLIAACEARGAEVAADINGPQLGSVLAKATRIPHLYKCGILLLKPNVEELGECLGRDLHGAGEGELADAAGTLLGRVGTVLVTRGRHGALAVSRGQVLVGSLEAGAPRNTVGCGDAFLAGYLAGLWRGMAFAESVRLAVACGAAQALADAPGQFSRARVEELSARVAIRALLTSA
ncbi:MAG: 1-phosphofructokinase family hexose kinase [Planctomycetes bacterium]|nr:1-phosphofructokinase family hexose kinase [Planctomycetota bacterium]